MTARGWLAPRVLFPLYERLSGRWPWTELRRLRTLQWRSPEELEARALWKLRPLLAHAYTHVPYYRDLFDGAGVRPDDIRTMSDLARVPRSGKAELRANFPARIVADNLPKRRRETAMTSGSTGLPFAFYTDRAGLDSRLGSYLFFREWAGVAFGDAALYIAAPPQLSPVRAHSSPLSRLARRLVLGERVIHLSGPDLRAARLVAELRRLPAKSGYWIWGWPSYVGRLAAELLETGVALPTAPRAIIAYAETLTAADAAAIVRAFQCRVTNHYSSYEVLHLAQTCPDNPEALHVNSERAVLRVVREDGSPAAPGESGRVVITDLTNRVMPFINYDIGDWAVAGAPCPCGRGFPTLTSPEGRVGEVIRTPGGKTITPVGLGWHIRQAFPYIWEYQAVQTAEDAVVLRIVPTTRFSADLARKLAQDLEEFLGPGLRVQVETVDRIAVEASGKRLIIKRSHGWRSSPSSLTR